MPTEVLKELDEFIALLDYLQSENSTHASHDIPYEILKARAEFLVDSQGTLMYKRGFS